MKKKPSTLKPKESISLKKLLSPKKKNLLFILTLIFSSGAFAASTITITNSYQGTADGVYNENGTHNGKARWEFTNSLNDFYVIRWTGTRWEIWTDWYNSFEYYHPSGDDETPPATGWYYYLNTPENAMSLSVNGWISTKENDKTLTRIAISPTPTTNNLHFSHSSHGLSFEIHNLTGKKVLTGIATSEPLDVSNLKRGIYLMRLGKTKLKIIKH